MDSMLTARSLPRTRVWSRYGPCNCTTISSVARSLPYSSLISLYYMYLSNNQLSGTLPNDLSFVPFLILANNAFQGSLPDKLHNACYWNQSDWNYWLYYEYCYLDLSNNEFSGQIPASYMTMSGMRLLNISHNHLSGTLPELPVAWRSYALCRSNVTSAGSMSGWGCFLDLSCNAFIGSLPPSYGYMNVLNYLDVGSNQLTGSLPPEFATIGNQSSWFDLRYRGPPTTLSSQYMPYGSGVVFRASWNSLTGTIPPTFGSIIPLRELHPASKAPSPRRFPSCDRWCRSMCLTTSFLARCPSAGWTDWARCAELCCWTVDC